MSNPEFKHLYKKQLRKRVKALSIGVYVVGIIALASFIVFFLTEYRFNWSWLLIGLTYTALAINFGMLKRRMQKEIGFREERLRKANAN